ncbi:MAG: hypothetical protein GTO17_13570 [Candidatus Aminicenantes bacterium]|nr:hypothetical protein [Candidatus Aminicenantes bacterium]
MKTKLRYLVIIPLGFLLIYFSSCTRDQLEAPAPFGPFGFAILVEMTANPNVLVGGNTRQKSIITTTVTAFDGEPLANRTIVFEVKDWHGRRTTDLGYLEGFTDIKTAITNGNGVISLLFYGPLSADLPSSADYYKHVYIWATLVHHGREVIKEVIPITLIQGG